MQWVMVVAVCAGVASADAAVLCKKKTGAVVLRDTACAKKETAIDPVALGLQGPKGDKGDQGDTGIPATAIWAVVNADGTLARGSHVTSTGRPADIFSTGTAGPTIVATTGTYEVVFDRDVTGCAFSATIGTATSMDPVDPGEIWAAPRFLNANGVYVATTDSSGVTAADRPFHLALFCP